MKDNSIMMNLFAEVFADRHAYRYTYASFRKKMHERYRILCDDDTIDLILSEMEKLDNWRVVRETDEQFLIAHERHFKGETQ